MKKIIKVLFVIGLMCLPLTSQGQAPSLVISEIGWAGSSLNSSDEWLELTNLTAATVDLTGWRIAGAATGGDTLSLPEGSLIHPKSTYLISNYDYEDERSALGLPAHFTTSGLSLSNSSLGLVLQNDQGERIDAAGTGGSPLAGGIEDVATTDGGGRRYLSMVRISAELDGENAAAWTDASQSIGFATATADFGTPGAVNLTIPETTEDPVEEQTDDNPPTLIINEIVSDPSEGQEEFIEVLNLGNATVDLSGWSVQDATAKSTLFPEEPLAGGEYHVIWQPRGILNNGGDVIELMDPDSAIIDRLEYGTEDIPAAADPNALARDPNGQFLVTGTPTPNAANQLTDAKSPEPPTEDPEPEPATDTQAESESEPGPEPESATDSQTQMEDSQEEEPGEEVIDEETADETTDNYQVMDANDETSEAEQTPEPAQDESEPEQEASETPDQTVNYTLELSELYANTLGEDAEEEFIEIHNTGNESVNLEGIILEDESGKQYVQNDFYRLAPGRFYALPRSLTKITLNNDGDLVRLFAPDNTLLDQESYAKTTKGQSWAQNGDIWSWTSQVTPNEPNSFPQNEIHPQSTESSVVAPNITTTSKRPVGSREPIRNVDIEQAKALADDTQVILQGVVSVEPGVLGKQIMYITDSKSGLQVYKYDSNYPELLIGHEVKVTGTMSTSHGERRVKITSEGSIDIIGLTNEPQKKLFPTRSLPKAKSGRWSELTAPSCPAPAHWYSLNQNRKKKSGYVWPP